MKSIADGWKYQADWIDGLHKTEATVYIPTQDEIEELRHEGEIWGGDVPYRDPSLFCPKIGFIGGRLCG